MHLKYTTPFVRTSLHVMAVLALLAGVTTNVSTAYAAAPSNNEFATAKKMSANTSVSISDINTATSNGTDPANSCTGDAGEKSVWYSFTPLASGELALATTSSAYDTVLTLWKEDPFTPGDPSALVEIKCNDDDPRTLNRKTSYLSIPVRGGVKYYIEVVRKTGTSFSPPDALYLGLAFATQVIAAPNWFDPEPYDDTSSVFTYSTGWTLTPFPPDQFWHNALHDSNHPLDTATVYFDGEQVALEYGMGPGYGNATILIDGVVSGTLGQNSLGYLSTKQGTAPLWYSPILSDNVHKIVIRNANSSLKINIDGIWIAQNTDFFPPDPITDLTATTGTTSGKVNLKWTAPGDDGVVGRVHDYEIRYSPNPITGLADWDAATPLVVGVPAPLPAGSTQTMTVQGLAPGLTYCFMVVGVDEAGNMGDPDFSNSDCAVSKAATLYGTGVYDDKSSAWIYDGVWQVVSKSEAYLKYYHLATKLGSSASFFFTGTQFRLSYISDFNMGLLDVYVDGLYVDTIDEYSPFILNRAYVSPILGNVPGPHFVQFVMTTLPYVNVDAILITSTTDGGPPDPIVDLVASPGLNDGEVELNWTATGDDPGGVGTATSYEVRYSSTPITSELEFLYAKPVGGSIPLPSAAGDPESMTILGLIPGVDYYFAVRALDGADGGYAVLSNTDDAVAYNAAGYAGPGLYEDSDVYGLGGFWRFYAWTAGSFPSASNGDMHTTLVSGASALFTFNGGSFTLYFQKGYKYGSLKVYVDGVLAGTISEKYQSTKWKQTWHWAGAAGNHTVQFVSGGGKTTIDAILIP